MAKDLAVEAACHGTVWLQKYGAEVRVLTNSSVIFNRALRRLRT